MIDTLIVGGCSFTAPNPDSTDSWPTVVAKHFAVDTLYNMAVPGAGNYYIKNSVIDTIERFQCNPETSLVLVMWSGISRKDFRISKEFYDYLFEINYSPKLCIAESPECCYVSSGGIKNSWQEDPAIHDLFKYFYLSNDKDSLRRSSLECFEDLKNYLVVHNFRYRFLNFQNYWTPQEPLIVDREFLLGSFDSHIKDSSSWIFNNNFTQDGFYEFAKGKNQLQRDRFHPDILAHKPFAEEVVIPKIKDLFLHN